MQLKYVITDNDCFALFSETTDHARIACGLWGKPVGAGFAIVMQKAGRSDLITVRCFGSSHTLKLDSRKEDGQIIEDEINNTY